MKKLLIGFLGTFISLALIYTIKGVPDKCWLHRINTVEKMLEVSNKYTGIEIDVNFNNSKLFFDVTHDLNKSMD